MAQSSCPKCGGHSFELKENAPMGSNFKVNFIQCAALTCGTVLGVMEYHNTAALLQKQNQQIAEAAIQANTAAINTVSIVDALNRLLRRFQVR